MQSHLAAMARSSSSTRDAYYAFNCTRHGKRRKPGLRHMVRHLNLSTTLRANHSA
jgi:hypothetical protein